MKRLSKLDEIVLRRRNIIVLDANGVSNEDNIRRVSIMIQNINSLGYTLSKELISTLRKFPCEILDDIYLDLISLLKGFVGADKTWKPMYPNFPQQIEDSNEIELYTNAVLHYLTNGEFMFPYDKEERLPLFETNDLVTIGLGKPEVFNEVLCNLISANTSLSEQDKEDLRLLFDVFGMYCDMPNHIPFKENAAFICKIIFNTLNIEDSVELLSKYLVSATDILRFITALSDGDLSLTDNTNYKSLKRQERRIILSLLNSCINLEEDLLRHKMKWLQVGRLLHVGEYPEYSNVFYAFDKLRNGGCLRTYNSKIDRLIEEKDVMNLVFLAKKRPGIFARKLDHFLRMFDDPFDKEYILLGFMHISSKVSIQVLLQLKEHFAKRNNKELRAFFIKGSTTKTYLKENDVTPFTDNVCEIVIKICENAIISQLKSKSSLGNVFIDEKLKGHCVPQGLRDSNSSLKVLTRGSRISIGEDCNSCRGFVWWKNAVINGNEQVTDIDLSALILNENYEYVTHISFTNLRNSNLKCYHSGDIVNGGSPTGNGASEFIDFDINSVLDNGGRYVIYQIYSYTGIDFNEMDDIMFGWMERSDVNCGEIFEPSTVKQGVSINSKSISRFPVMFDCLTREFVWVDLSGNGTEVSLERAYPKIVHSCLSVLNATRPSMYDLAVLNAKARGTIVKNVEDADVVFSSNDIDIADNSEEIHVITPYMLDYWASEMM